MKLKSVLIVVILISYANIQLTTRYNILLPYTSIYYEQTAHHTCVNKVVSRPQAVNCCKQSRTVHISICAAQGLSV